MIRKDCYLNGYRVRSGVIETGAVTVGAGAFVGEQTVLDIDTVLGDGAQLGHASALHAGQVVPAGQCWHGSPAQPADPGLQLPDRAPRPLRHVFAGPAPQSAGCCWRSLSSGRWRQPWRPRLLYHPGDAHPPALRRAR